MKGSFPGIYPYYPENYLSKLKEVTYFLEEQRGGKGRRAITKALNLEAAAAAIEVLIGIPVRSIRWTVTIDGEYEVVQPEAEAQPATAPAAPIETAAAPPVENPAMPVNPSTDTVVPTPPGVGNIRWWLGSPFDPDWETPMAPHFGMECETRFTDWRVWFADGNATTVIEHEPKTAADFWGWASGLTGAKQAAPIRGVAA